MTQGFSLDLCVRVAAFVEAGHSCRAARQCWNYLKAAGYASV
jgi:hypothetical protein